MIIVHENLTEESEEIARVFREVYGFDSVLHNRDLTSAFLPIPQFNGFWCSENELYEHLNEFDRKKFLVVTPRDVYAGDESKEDDWIFGYKWGNLTLASTARMKREDNLPSDELVVPREKYIKRLEVLAIHEVGHEVVKAKHFKDAVWVNAKTGHQLSLGPHCTDNTCVMYEVVDINSPPKEEGYMLLGDEMKYDNGLNQVVERLTPDWFCGRCKESIAIDESYK